MRYLFIVTLFFFLISGTQAHAATILVRGTDATADGGGCGDVSNPCNTVQAGVNQAASGDLVFINPGTYIEQVSITKSLVLQGSASTTAIIKAPPTLLPSMATNQNILTIDGSGITVEVSNLSVTGPSTPDSGSRYNGVNVRGGATVNIHDARILDVRDDPFAGGQRGIAIAVGRSAEGAVGHATISYCIISGYQKLGILVDGSGSSATISNSHITGAGPTTINGQNAIQISRGATATIQSNSISGNYWSANDGNASVGILLYQSSDVTISSNTITQNNVGVYIDTLASYTIQYNQFISNSVYAIDNESGTQIDARNNWWNSVTGPTHATNPNGVGDPVTDDVDFSSWITDVTPPTISSIDPSSGAVSVAVDTSIEAVFSESVYPTSVDTSSFTLTDSMSQSVTGTVSVSGATVTFVPDEPLAVGMTYTARLTNAIIDFSGNSFAGYSWSFTTISDLDAPRSVSTAVQNPPAIKLTWTYSTSVVDGFNLYRSLSSNGPFTLLAALPYSNRTYTDTKLTSGITYFYRVTAHQGAVESAPALANVLLPDTGAGGLPNSAQGGNAATTTTAIMVASPYPAGVYVKLVDDKNPLTQADSAVYYVGADGKRHVFTNSKVYFSWRCDFIGITTLTSEQMAEIPLGANITYRPGSRLVKFLSLPTTYIVLPGALLRPIGDEELAQTLYGQYWAHLVDDISDSYFLDYTIGAPVSSVEDYNPTSPANLVQSPDDVLAIEGRKPETGGEPLVCDTVPRIPKPAI